METLNFSLLHRPVQIGLLNVSDYRNESRFANPETAGTVRNEKKNRLRNSSNLSGVQGCNNAKPMN